MALVTQPRQTLIVSWIESAAEAGKLFKSTGSNCLANRMVLGFGKDIAGCNTWLSKAPEQ